MKASVACYKLSKLAVFVVLIPGIAINVSSAHRADSLRRDLYRAVLTHDETRVKRCLRNGANPNLRGTLLDPKTFNDKLTSLFSDSSSYPTPLLASLTKYALTQYSPGRYYFVPRPDTNPSAGIVKALLDAGADPNATDYYYTTPLQQAVRSDNAECVQLLILHGAKLGSHGNDSALDVAVKEGTPRMVEGLVKLGSRAGEIDGNGETGLHVLAYWPRANAVAIAQVLVAYGCPLKYRDKQGLTPEDIVSSRLQTITNTAQVAELKKLQAYLRSIHSPR